MSAIRKYCIEDSVGVPFVAIKFYGNGKELGKIFTKEQLEEYEYMNDPKPSLITSEEVVSWEQKNLDKI
jgi:hypothetical protein